MIPKTILALALAMAALTGCATSQDHQAAFAAADYDPAPEVNKPELEAWVRSGLKDPDSAKFRWEALEKARWRPNGFSAWKYGWRIKLWVNAKNGFGGYTGEEPYVFVYYGGVRVDTIQPWQVPRAQW